MVNSILFNKPDEGDGKRHQLIMDDYNHIKSQLSDEDFASVTELATNIDQVLIIIYSIVLNIGMIGMNAYLAHVLDEFDFCIRKLKAVDAFDWPMDYNRS